MDFIAFAGTNLFLKRGRKYRFLPLGAAVAAFLSVVCLLAVKNYMLYCLVTHFLINTAMIRIVFGRCSAKTFLENWAVTYLIVILLGGMMEWLGGSGALARNLLLAVPAAAPGVYGALYYLMRRRSFGNHMMRAQIRKDARYIELVAYWDSGNQLRDPYTGQGISIISQAKAREFVDGKKDRIRFVPYRSLGETDGLLAVLDVDEMVVQDGERKQKFRHMAIGIAQKGLLEDKAYDMILHASLG